jgi:hypothetical protein
MPNKTIRRHGLVVRVVDDKRRGGTYYQFTTNTGTFSFAEDQIDDIIVFAEIVRQHRQEQ